jgi:hypothetical protein
LAGQNATNSKGSVSQIKRSLGLVSLGIQTVNITRFSQKVILTGAENLIRIPDSIRSTYIFLLAINRKKIQKILLALDIPPSEQYIHVMLTALRLRGLKRPRLPRTTYERLVMGAVVPEPGDSETSHG